jgi:hypothetical protein
MTGGVALLVGGVVVSHWVLDFVTHAPDMPLWPGSSPRVGLGLWRSVPATFFVEGALFVAGIALYARAAPSVLLQVPTISDFVALDRRQPPRRAATDMPTNDSILLIAIESSPPI